MCQSLEKTGIIKKDNVPEKNKRILYIFTNTKYLLCIFVTSSVSYVLTYLRMLLDISSCQSSSTGFAGARNS